MSLRIFHVVFITLCIALSVYVAIWGVREFIASKSWSALGLSAVFVVGGAALVAYAGKAFRKLRDL
jgi:hypothetical protein